MDVSVGSDEWCKRSVTNIARVFNSISNALRFHKIYPGDSRRGHYFTWVSHVVYVDTDNGSFGDIEFLFSEIVAKMATTRKPTDLYGDISDVGIHVFPQGYTVDGLFRVIIEILDMNYEKPKFVRRSPQGGAGI